MLLSMAALRKDAMSLQADKLMDSLEVSDKIDLIIHSFNFPSLLDSFQYVIDQDEVHNILSSTIINQGDQAPLTIKVREGILPISVLLRMNPLMKLLLSNGAHIPLTAAFLLQNAIKEECWDLLIDLGEIFPKKEILKTLTKCPHKHMITTFIVRYKEDPEIKRLIPFI
jgi:hypothetical protein